MGTPHKWAKEIHAWADGEEIQYRLTVDGTTRPWADLPARDSPAYYPAWNSNEYEFRIKPKPPIVRYASADLALAVGPSTLGALRAKHPQNENAVRLEFDPETKKLLKAEVV